MSVGVSQHTRCLRGPHVSKIWLMAGTYVYTCVHCDVCMCVCVCEVGSLRECLSIPSIIMYVSYSHPVRADSWEPSSLVLHISCPQGKMPAGEEAARALW